MGVSRSVIAVLISRMGSAHAVWLVSVIASFVSTAQATGGDQSADVAREILKTTGVKGGLIVHIGCADGKLTEALAKLSGALVQGLDGSDKNVTAARNYFQTQNLSNKVTALQIMGDRLPYIDNLVNLIVSEELGDISMAEIMRVLAPNGVAYIKKGGRWTKAVKRRSEEIDEWTHYLHDATGNAVSHDVVSGPPRRMQWLSEPQWTRNHHKLASVTSIVSAAGRIFYIVDESSAGNAEVASQWFLTARDAFNGVLLWKKEMPHWAWHLQKFRSGPVQLPRLLVAEGDKVYVTLETSAAASILDAADGEVLAVCENTKNAEEIVLSDGRLFVITSQGMVEHAMINPQRRGRSEFPTDRTIVAVDAHSGKELWNWSQFGEDIYMPLTLASDGPGVYCQAGDGAVCLEAKTGTVRWRKSGDGKITRTTKRRDAIIKSIGLSVSTLVVSDGVALLGAGTLRAYDVRNGKILWETTNKPGFRSATDIFVIDGVIWRGPDFSSGLDLKTGKKHKVVPALSQVQTAGHHHRCYRNKATDKFLVLGKRGIEFIDVESKEYSRNNWIRGLCQYGVMPCNGLVYAPPHSCGCYMESMLYGFWALAPEKKIAEEVRTEPLIRLEKGPAYGKAIEIKPSDSKADWPTWRGDMLRSGSTAMELPGKLKSKWQVELGGKLSAPVIAGGKVFAACIDSHQVISLDESDGKTLWTYTVGGRIDSPPTIYQGKALFGCADGWVYCLDASDGRLIWRFRAATDTRQAVSLDQLESLWPVHGNILVHKGVAYFSAGRSSHLDGGITVWGLDPTTGKTVCKSQIDSVHPTDINAGSDGEIERVSIKQNMTDYKTFTESDKSDSFSMAEGVTGDVMVSNGSSIFLRHLQLDDKCRPDKNFARHLFSTSTFMDDNENHRSHWVLGSGNFSRMPVAYSWIAYKPGNYGYHLATPFGLTLSFDDNAVWGVHRTKDYQYKLYAEKNRPFDGSDELLPDFRKWEKGDGPNFNWLVDLPMRPRALTRAGGRLVLGGYPYSEGEKPNHAAYNDAGAGVLMIMNATDGGKISETVIKAAPVWDGLAVANERLYMSMTNGVIGCWGR